MKVIIVDNYDRETVSDTLFKDNLTEEEALAIVKEENGKRFPYEDSDHPQYFKMVKDDYKLYDASSLYL